jgi:hypothetical protein
MGSLCRLRDFLALTTGIGILCALLIPVCGGGHARARVTDCANNLQQLYRLGTAYASTHQGAWPSGKGSALWLAFSKTTPPLVTSEELWIFACPVRGEWESGDCDYLGPIKPASALKPMDALGADKPGNHGEDLGGNVLMKDGSGLEFDRKHPIWETLLD